MKKSIISSRCEGVCLVGDGLALSGIAKKHKAEDKSVINATLGTLYDEQGKFYRMNAVDRLIKSFDDDSFYQYSPSDGGAEFSKACINWVFGEELSKLKDLEIKCVASPGGTGAVNNGLYIASDPNETILLPDLYWSPYLKMADVNKLNVSNYQMIKDNKVCKKYKLLCHGIFDKKSGRLTNYLEKNHDENMVRIRNHKCFDSTERIRKATSYNWYAV